MDATRLDCFLAGIVLGTVLSAVTTAWYLDQFKRSSRRTAQ